VHPCAKRLREFVDSENGNFTEEQLALLECGDKDAPNDITYIHTVLFHVIDDEIDMLNQLRKLVAECYHQS